MNKAILKFAMSAIAASMLSLSFSAAADTPPEDVNRFVKMYDSNKDGMVSKAELMKRANEMFDKMDTAKKGMADDKKTIAFLFELQRTDGSTGSMMPKAEIMKKIEMTFDKMDSGKKGMLDMKQAEAFLRELMKFGG